MFDREFELLEYRQCWGEDRVFYLDDEGELRALPARWTSAITEEPLVVIGAGRSLFRVDDLLELLLLIQEIRR